LSTVPIRRAGRSRYISSSATTIGSPSFGLCRVKATAVTFATEYKGPTRSQIYFYVASLIDLSTAPGAVRQLGRRAKLSPDGAARSSYLFLATRRLDQSYSALRAVPPKARHGRASPPSGGLPSGAPVGSPRRHKVAQRHAGIVE
jgi:hypothetical protein